MLSFHIQNSPQDWPQAVARLLPGSPVKFTSGWERCTEAKIANPNIKTWVRHVEPQPHPHGDPDQLARQMFQRFVNPEAPFWKYVDYVQGWNEFYAESQDDAEENLWVDFDVACARVWLNEYRLVYPVLKDIRYIMSEPGVGNDIPLRAARGSVEYDALLGYHAYFLVNDGVIADYDWHDLSGRFEAMDRVYKAAGLSVDWIFGEAGAYRDNKSGWRHDRVYGGDINVYIAGLKYWLDNTVKTDAYLEGRIYGSVLFTSGGGEKWEWFEIAQPHMNQIADFARNYPYPPIGNPPADDFQDELWNESIERQVISLNPNAALQAAIFDDEFTPVQSEFRYTVDGVQYAVQAGENVATGDRRVYYAEVPKWDQVEWYTPEETFTANHGVDVSHHQGEIDWSVMAAREDVGFAYIRASQGTRTDSYFGRNWAEAKLHNIPRGAYHYLRMDVDVKKQIDHFLSLVGHDYGEMPLCLDVEDQLANKAKIKTAIDYLTAQYTRPIIIYTSPGYWAQLGMTTWANEHLLWVANWTNAEMPQVPIAWDDWHIWQYTNQGDGALYGCESTYIDLNRING